MLWLAGLIGVIGAGAASFVLPYPETDVEADENDNLAVDAEQNRDTMDDLEDLLWLDDDYVLAGDDPASDDDVPADTTANADLQDIADDPFDTDIPMIGPDVSEVVPQNSETPLWDWIMQGAPAEVVDYAAENESLMLVWDDLEDGASEPEVRVEQDPFDTEVMHVVMNDCSVAEVYGDPNLTTSDVTVIPLSSALAVGLEAA